MKSILTFAVFFLAASAGAVDSKQCPGKFAVEMSRASIYKSSVNKAIPGWLEAREILAESNIEGTSYFDLVSRNKDSCFYKDHAGKTAKLFSAIVYDPEVPEDEQEASDFLSIRMPVENLSLSVFLDVSKFAPDSIEFFSQSANHRARLKVRLINPITSKPLDYEIGLIRMDSVN